VRLAEHGMLTTGEKLPTVEEAESRLRFAREQLTAAEKQFAIDEPLFREGVIAAVTFNLTQNTLELARIGVETAEKTLAVVRTGAKPETVAVNQAQIQALRARLNLLRQRHANFVVTAPFDATVSPVQLPEEVLLLQNTDEYLVQIPVRVTDLRFVGPGATIRVKNQADGTVHEAELLETGRTTQPIAGQYVNFIAASVQPDPARPLHLGMAVQCVVRCDELTPWQYLRRLYESGILIK
jgi:multidrug resistance efflux pump